MTKDKKENQEDRSYLYIKYYRNERRNLKRLKLKIILSLSGLIILLISMLTGNLDFILNYIFELILSYFYYN